MPDERLHLTGEHVELVPLAPEHVADLVVAATIDRSSYGFTEVPGDAEHMTRYVDNLLAKRRAGTDLPFVQRRRGDGRVVGCTRFIEMRRWRGRPEPDEVEIGGTWLAADVQRTAAQHRGQAAAADARLRACGTSTGSPSPPTPATSAAAGRSSGSAPRSRASCATTARRWSPGEAGRPRDTALFSITDDEWPDVRRDLQRPAWACPTVAR